MSPFLQDVLTRGWERNVLLWETETMLYAPPASSLLLQVSLGVKQASNPTVLSLKAPELLPSDSFHFVGIVERQGGMGPVSFIQRSPDKSKQCIKA